MVFSFQDFYKMNVDVAFVESLDSYGIGWVGRNSRGIVLVAERKFYSSRFSPHIAKIFVVKESLLQASKLG